MASQWLDARRLEARPPHPGRTLGAGKIKPPMRINEHSETHEQAIGMLAPVVIDERLVHEEGPPGGSAAKTLAISCRLVARSQSWRTRPMA